MKNNSSKEIIGVVCLFLMMLFIITDTLSAQSSANYIITKSSLNQGGNTSSSAAYSVQDAIAQPSPVGPMSSANYGVSSGFFSSIPVGTAIEEEEQHELIDVFKLKQNYPNPFNPETTIRFSVKENCTVKLNVYNIQGKRVASVVNKEYQPGSYEVIFNGSKLPSGIYLYRLQAGNFTEVKRMLLLE